MGEQAVNWGALPDIYYPTGLSGGVLGAAFRLAEKAHPPTQHRRKPQGGLTVPYLCHPVLCFKILRAHGIHDKATLMAALLHDALEPSKGAQGMFIGRPDMLRQALEGALQQAGESQPYQLSEEVIRLVVELTPDKGSSTQKTERQRAEALKYSGKARLIKLADHAATLMDDLFVPPSDAKESQAVFVDRARATAAICGDVSATDESRSPQVAMLHARVQNLADQRTQWIALSGQEAEVYRQKICTEIEKEMALALHSAESSPLIMVRELPRIGHGWVR